MSCVVNKKLKGASLQQAKNHGLATTGFKCLSFEQALWFHMHKTMWTKSRNVFSEQERYLSQHITKPFKWSMVKYCERICELYDSLQYLPPHSLIFQLWQYRVDSYFEAPAAIRKKMLEIARSKRRSSSRQYFSVTVHQEICYQIYEDMSSTVDPQKVDPSNYLTTSRLSNGGQIRLVHQHCYSLLLFAQSTVFQLQLKF